MYKNLGYIIYRTVLEYYSGSPDEDAYGMLQVLHKSNNVLTPNDAFFNYRHAKIIIERRG